MTTSPDVGSFSLTRSRVSTSPEAINRTRKIVQARIVADDEQRVRVARLADKADERFGAGVVDALVLRHSRRLGKGRRDQRPGFLRARHRRYQDEVRNKPVAGEIGADDGRVGAAARRQLAIAVTLAGLGALGLGMA